MLGFIPTRLGLLPKFLKSRQLSDNCQLFASGSFMLLLGSCNLRLGLFQLLLQFAILKESVLVDITTNPSQKSKTYVGATGNGQVEASVVAVVVVGATARVVVVVVIEVLGVGVPAHVVSNVE